MPLAHRPSDNPHFFLFILIYGFFIIYGSLVPLDYHPKPFETAWLSFKQIRYLNLGAASRADWIANIILYVPLTFSLAAYFTSNHKSSLQVFLITALILFGSISLAITIEFHQQFFPPRTVSQNDLIAETIGSIIGLALWFSYGKRILELHNHIILGGRNAFLASATVYTVSYFAISFFPYDFVTSFQELHSKLDKGNNAFLLSSSCGNVIRCTAKLASEVLLTIPLGIFVSVMLRWHRKRLTAVMLVGFVIGIIIEAVQLFLVSGIAQGISIFTRILGMGMGEKLYKNIGNLQKALQIIDLRKHIVIASIPYIIVLAGLNGWSLSGNALTGNIAEKSSSINWLPFYYHYYTTETVALTSLLSVLLMYMPVGLSCWLWNKAGNNSFYSTNFTAGFLSMGIALIMEISKLFLIDKHPDPTNLLISFASAYLTFSVAELMYRWFHQPETPKYVQRHDVSHVHAESSSRNPEVQENSSNDQLTGNFVVKFIAALISAILAWKLAGYPGNSLAFASILAIYIFLLHKYPQTWLVAIPALLPIFDFSPWTGRLFFSELDYLILMTIIISYWNGRISPPSRALIPGAQILLGIYLFFYLISMARGLLPFQPLDANAFTHYYSHYNSLRIGKGLLWAILLVPVLSYNLLQQKETLNYFSYGILSGLTLTSLFAIWERAVFTGLFDFNSDFRISSTFYSMHTGGAHLDAFLLMCMPFIGILLTHSRFKVQNIIFAILLFSISFYTLLMTFSRGAYIAFVIAFAVLCLALIKCYKQEAASNWKKILWFPVFILLIAAISIPALKGSFIQSRFKKFNAEVTTRSTHWINSINMMDSDLATTLFGMGLGSFPRNYFWKNFDEITPATFNLQREQENSYFQLRGGAPLYIEQKIETSTNTQYQLQLDYRTFSDNSGLSIQICEKAIQHSFNCQGVHLTAENSGNWHHFKHTIKTKYADGDKKGLFSNFLSRPIKFVLSNNHKDTIIDLKNISLFSPTGTNLIQNGDFSADFDHWFFTTDNHIPWRTENLWIQILFEQGWMGLLTFSLLLLFTLINLYQKLTPIQFHSSVLLSSLSGFIIINVVDSSFDAPNITLLFFLLLFLSYNPVRFQKFPR